MMTETYIPKYKHSLKTNKKSNQGCPVRPDKWITGPDPIRHDKYYGYLKHRAQAKFRNEPHTLTWEEWETLWPNDKWFERGRKAHNLTLIMIDPDIGWCAGNVEVTTKQEYLNRASEYRDRS